MEWYESEKPILLDKQGKPWWLFSFEYEDKGKIYSVDVPALSESDARSRLLKATRSPNVSVIIETYPVALGFIVKIKTFIDKITYAIKRKNRSI